MAAISTNARRLPGPIVAVIVSLLFVALTLLILRIVLNPNEESMRTSAEAARPRRVAVATRTQASTATTAATTTADGTTAAETDGLPGLGDSLVAEDGLGVTLVAIEDFSEMPQRQGASFRPRKDLIRIVTIEFENGSGDPTTVVNTNISLLRPDDSRIVVDSRSLNALTSKPAGTVESRPLFLAESIAAGRSIVVSVSFDVEESDGSHRLDIEGLTFALPAINLLDQVADEVESAAATEAGTEAATEAGAEAEATPVAEDVRDTRAGSSLDTTENRGRARIEAVEQTAVSRTGAATVGDTQLGDDGLEVTLVSVQQFEEFAQVHGSPFRPKNGAFKLVTIQFTNTNDSGNIVVSKANIVLIEPSGNEIIVSSPGVNALIGMATTATEGRPLFLVESVPNGKTAVVAVVFDVAPDLADLEIDIEGFIFEVPNP